MRQLFFLSFRTRLHQVRNLLCEGKAEADFFPSVDMTKFSVNAILSDAIRLKYTHGFVPIFH